MMMWELFFLVDFCVFSVIFQGCCQIHKYKTAVSSMDVMVHVNLHSVQCPGGCQAAEGEHVQTERSSCPPQLLHSPHRHITVWKTISRLIWRGGLELHSHWVMLLASFHVRNVSVGVTCLNFSFLCQKWRNSLSFFLTVLICSFTNNDLSYIYG